MPKILFVAAHRPGRSPSQRFRFEQYIDFLKDNGFDSDFSFLVSSEDDLYLYEKGHLLKKYEFLCKSYSIRSLDLKNLKNYDCVFVQREALMFRSIKFEKAFSMHSKLVFDFDDAIWLMDVSEGNKKWKWLKNPAKTEQIIKLSHMVFAGNKYLFDYASLFNKNVKIVPTTIDTDYHKKKTLKKNNDKICIGWTGSITTIKHFRMAENFLKKIKDNFGDKIYFKLIGSETYENEKLKLKGIRWNKETEIDDLSEIDIGIMPLPNDEWTKGKCGFKGLQYMALEIPTVMSAIGVNNEIIQDGENGFLANTEEEWIEKISQLIESKELREKLGAGGRQTVIEKYSVESQKNYYLAYFKELIQL
ncbi:MAG TPA: glycosyltransferase family 4 protein [Bacteroidales bacterium]|nr:glycosyltransferase family 4 protein [Bacteroidales bacterium]HPS15935.1 glycosyltransferase family 4 protein [Bacteroidales bacterium]